MTLFSLELAGSAGTPLPARLDLHAKNTGSGVPVLPAFLSRGEVTPNTGARHSWWRWMICAVAFFLQVNSGLSANQSPGTITEKPLAPHPFPRGKTMYVVLPPEQTGIVTTNNFADPRMKGELYQEFETSSIGTGIAVGDYDGDGLPDIFVVSKTESCRLFRNLGGFKFEDVTEKAGVGDHGEDALVWKQGATFVDVNNDGRLDLYLCRSRGPNRLYINQGNGTFKEMAQAYGLAINDSSVMAAFCDYDRDGWLDVYIATNILDIAKHPKGQRGYLLHNNRNGSFSNVTEHGGIIGETQSHSATWWDYDNDGWPDLYVAYDYGLPDSLYHNNRDGTFSDVMKQVAPHTSFSSMGADLGDVNNDGLIDFFVADMAATTHQTDFHSLADARGRSEEFPRDANVAPKYHRNALLLNTGLGPCQEAAFLAGIAATDWTWSPRLADLDNDGHRDLHITNGFPRDPGEDTVRRMMKAETPAERIRIMYATAPQAEPNYGFRNLGNLEFVNATAEWGFGQKGVSFGAAFGDFAGDGNLGLIYSNYGAGATFMRNDESAHHRVIIDLRGTVSNRFGVGAVVKIESELGTQVEQLWLSRGYMSNSEPAVHFGLGNDAVIKRLTVTWPSGHVQTFENLGVDRRFTITEPNDATNTSKPLEEKRPVPRFKEVSESAGLLVQSREDTVDELTQQRLLPIRLNARGPALAVGAIDESGRECVVVGGTTADPRRVFQSDANGHFALMTQSALGAGSEINDGPLLLFDADGDGFNDLLVSKGGNALPAGEPEYQPRLFLNDGHGQFRSAPEGALPKLSISAGAAAAADFDRDGHLDVFIGARVLPGQYPLAPQSALLVNRGGRFEDMTQQLAPTLREVGMVTSALWTDVDDDGWLDLLLTLDWGTVRYFHNDEGHGFTDRSAETGFAAAGSGWWNSIAGADFNGDGRIDYVVGNLGLNTQYHANAAHPGVLYAGDFKGDGSSQLIEGYYEGDRLYPWRTRRDMVAVFPSIQKRFPWSDNYASATLNQIFGDDKLASAQRFTATEFRSGVFLSQKDGTYRFEPLPRITQIAPLQGIVTGDFDGDGNTDIYAVQNSYAPIPYVGRFDGGLSQLFRGDGKGGFEAVPPAESGLIVPGDAKALVTLDLNQDAWPDFVASQNFDSTRAFANGGSIENHPLKIVLRGSAGNRTAIGARVSVKFADGTTATDEVYAGAGYYSQSSSALFFGYRASNAPQAVHVRWPDGSVSDHSIASGARMIEIAKER